MPTFSKHERLKSRKTIAQLFKVGKGNSFVAYPLRVLWLDAPMTGEAPPTPLAERDGAAQIAISVPKRAFKTAVARNRIKRQIREAYRLHKAGLYEKLAGRRVSLMLVYIAKEALPYAEIEAGVKKMIRKFPS